MELTFRQASAADAELIRQLAEQVFPATYRDILSPEQLDYMMDWMYAPESIRRQMADGHVYYLAIADGREAGYVSIEQQGPDLFHLQKIYVLPAFQKLSLGRRLFEQAVAAIKALHPGPCTMELNVNRQNPALGFYERMGMRRVRQGDFPIGRGYFMTDYIMALDL